MMGLSLRPAWEKSLARDVKGETSFGIGILPLGHCSYSFPLQQEESSNPDSLGKTASCHAYNGVSIACRGLFLFPQLRHNEWKQVRETLTGSSSTSRKDDINIGTVVGRHVEDCQLNGVAECR